MATITYDPEALGRGGNRPVQAKGAGRTLRFITGQFSFDASYPTGGEDISDIFNQLASLQGIQIDSPIGSTGTGLHTLVDYTNKKVQLFTNAVDPIEVTAASDQSNAANLRFIAWGY